MTGTRYKMDSNAFKMPIVDIEVLDSSNATSEDLRNIGKELVTAGEQIGFLYLINHGFDDALLKRLNDNAEKFFSLDQNTKEKYNRKHVRGYQGRGVENLDESSQGTARSSKGSFHPIDGYRESFDSSPLMKDDNFPDLVEVPELSKTLDEFFYNCAVLGKKLMKAYALGLGLQENALTSFHSELFSRGSKTSTVCRMLFYPGIEEEVPENALRTGVHSDYGTFTFLFQDNIGGLELLDKNNVWQKATPMQNTIVFNFGDCSEIWTAGRIRSTKHRVIMPKDRELRKQARRSYTLFFQPDNEAIIKPFFPDPEGKYSPIGSLDHVLKRIKESRIHRDD